MAGLKTPLKDKSFEERRADILADLEKFAELLRNMAVRFSGNSIGLDHMRSAVRLYNHALEDLQAKGVLSPEEVFREKKLMSQVIKP